MSNQIPKGTDVDGDMTPEEQRIAIARACGWSVIDMSDPLKVVVEGQAIWPHSVKDCPDYLNDLNAMHEAMETLTDDQLFTMSRWLQHSTRSTLIGVAVMHSTAAQRAEAFLKTLNLYK